MQSPVRFDRSFLPGARFEFAVISDTHNILDTEPYAVEFRSVRNWPARARWAAGMAADIGGDFLIHLGGLTEENASKKGQLESREEAFSVAPPSEQGRNDPPKLGMLLVRVLDDGARVHFVPTRGQTEPDPLEAGWSRLLTRTSQDLQNSPLGLFLRTPFAAASEGALAWPSALRQGIRDDHPFLACLELGARHVRVPLSDLDSPLQMERLSHLREEGVELTAFCL